MFERCVHYFRTDWKLIRGSGIVHKNVKKIKFNNSYTHAEQIIVRRLHTPVCSYE